MRPNKSYDLSTHLVKDLSIIIIIIIITNNILLDKSYDQSTYLLLFIIF